MYAAMVAFTILGAVTLASYALFFRRTGVPPGSGGSVHEPIPPMPDFLLRPEWNWTRIYIVFCGVAIALTGFSVYDYLFVPQPLDYWWMAVLVLAAAFVITENRFGQSAPSPVAAAERHELCLWVVSGALATFLLFVHYSELDDTFYVSLAARAADNPSAPLMTQDPMHGIEGTPILNPAHIVSSHELLAGAVSLLTGIEPIYIFHWGIATLAALLVPLALAQFFRVLIPEWWIWGVVGTLAVLISAGDVHRWYGNFLVAKLWFGKSILLMVLVPLIAHYAIAFARRPTAGRWLILAMAQVAAVGLTSTGLFVAPAVATLSYVATTSWSRHGVVRLLFVMASSAYVLAAALWLRSHMAFLNEYLAAAAQGGERFGSYPAHETAGDWFDVALVEVFGRGRLLAAALLTVSLAWMAYPRNVLARRFLILVPLCLFVTLLNPYLEQFVVAHVTATAHWRLMWILPVPAMIALVLISPLQWRVKSGRVLSGLLLLCFVLLVPARPSFSPANYVYIHTPTAKHGASVMAAAQALNERVPAGSSLLAPERISNVLPQFRDSAFPLVPRVHYLRYIVNFRGVFSEEEFDRRTQLQYLMDLAPEHPANDRHVQRLLDMFRTSISAYNITGVALHKLHPYRSRLETVLEDSGFTRNWQNESFVVWTRD